MISQFLRAISSDKYFCFVTGLAIIAACAVFPQASIADGYIPPDKVKVTTPVYRPAMSEFSPALGTYVYEVAWQGIPAATLTVNVEQEGLRYHIDTEAKTNKAIDVFYKLRYYGEAKISAIDLMPYETYIDSRENKKVKTARISFLENGEILSVRTRNGKQEPLLKFDPNNFTLDPFSAAFLARSLNWKKGETKKFDTFNGKTRYLISLTAEDKVNMKINDQKKDVWVISPKVKKLTETNPKKKLREAKIYVTADSAREILLIASEVFVGTVTTTLKSFTPSTRPAPRTTFAKSKRELFFE